MQATQTNAHSTKQVAPPAGSTMTPARHAGAVTRAPAWTAAWDNHPPASLFGPPLPLQAKLTVNEPGDAYEQEADQVAAQVMRMPDSAMPVQRKCACGGDAGPDGECAACRAKRLDAPRSATRGSQPASVPPIVHSVLGAPGRPLDASPRAFMEPRFGHSFASVRIHTDTAAARSARAINARAYTVGQSIVFGAGQYAPETPAGRTLLAHELTHVLQQGAGQAEPAVQKAASDASAAANYNIDDTINTLAMGLAVAEATLADPDLPAARREKITQQVEKLQPLLGQLQQERGTDGAGLTFDFDPDPYQNEINPGDADKSLDELYAGFSPSSAMPAGPGLSTDESDTTRTVQASALPGGLQITPLTMPGVQRCEVICVGVIVLVGLLVAGCESNRAPAARTTPCTATETTNISTRHATALSWVNDAVAKLTAYQNGSAPPDARTLVTNALQTNFHTADPATVTRIAQKLAAIQTLMSGSSYHYKCECSGTADAFTYSGGNPEIHLCAPWFASSDDIRRHTTLIHEMGHAVGLLGTAPPQSNRSEDIYEFHAVYRTMTPDQAINNPDPYAVFARQLFHNGAHPPGSHR